MILAGRRLTTDGRIASVKIISSVEVISVPRIRPAVRTGVLLAALIPATVSPAFGATRPDEHHGHRTRHSHKKHGHKKHGHKKKRLPTVAPAVLFNAPTGNARQQRRIPDRIIALIRHTPKGAHIYVAMYHFTDTAIARELAAAAARKVGVRIVVDSSSTKLRVYPYLRRRLGHNVKARSWIIPCRSDRSCLASQRGPGQNHNKFYLFSRTYGSRNVVVQTSANATPGASTGQWNDALVLTDPRLATAYWRYFWALARQHRRPEYGVVTRSGQYVLQFFPKAQSDPVERLLDGVRCAGHTVVRVTSGYLDQVSIARRLVTLGRKGCDVRVAVSIFGATALRTLSALGGARVRYFPADEKAGGHSKYVLVDGEVWGGHHKIVVTGSHSFTGVSLRSNDESMLTISAPGVYNAYLANFDHVWRAAHGTVNPPGHGPGPAVVVPTGGAVTIPWPPGHGGHNKPASGDLTES